MGNCQSRLCVKADSSAEDIKCVRQCRSEKSARGEKKGPRATALESPQFTRKQFEEVKKICESTDPSERVMRDEEIQERVRQVVVGGDKEVSSPISKKKKKRAKRKKRRKNKKQLNGDKDSNQAADQTLEQGVSRDSNGGESEDSGRSGIRALFQNVYRKIVKPSEETTGEVIKNQGEALGRRFPPAGDEASTSRGLRSSTGIPCPESDSSDDNVSDISSDGSHVNVQKRLARCHKLRKRMRKKTQFIMDVDARNTLPPDRSPSLNFSHLFLDSESNQSAMEEEHRDANDGDSLSEGEIDPSVMQRLNERMERFYEQLELGRSPSPISDDEVNQAMQRFNGRRGRRRISRYRGQLEQSLSPSPTSEFESDPNVTQSVNELLMSPSRMSNTNGNPASDTESEGSVFIRTRAYARIRQQLEDHRQQLELRNPRPVDSRSSTPPTPFENLLDSGFCLSRASVNSDHTPNRVPNPRRNRNDSVEGWVSCSDDEEGEDDLRGQIRTWNHSTRTWVYSSRSGAPTARPSAPTTRPSAPTSRFRFWNPGVRTFARAAGTTSTSSAAQDQSSRSRRSPVGTVFRELLRLARRSRGSVTPEPYSHGNPSTGNFLDGLQRKGPKTSNGKQEKITQVMVQPCEPDQPFNTVQRSVEELSDIGVDLSASLASSSSRSSLLSSQASNNNFDARPADFGGT